MDVKVTKYVHSCVLVETESSTVIIDPGKFSWDSKIFNIEKLTELDAVVITHEHFDHFAQEFISALTEKFPEVKIITTSSVKKILTDIFGDSINLSSHSSVEQFDSVHNDLPFDFPIPENIGVHIDGVFTHPGDSNTFKETKHILAMPMTAPWGSMAQSTRLIEELQPKVVLPVHDWHWRPEALKDFYSTCESRFAKKGIKFIIPIDGATEMASVD